MLALSWYWNDEGENGPPCLPEAEIAVAGLICNAGAVLTVSAALTLRLPWPLDEFVKVTVAALLPTAKLFAVELTVKVMVIGVVVAVPDAEETVSQFGTPEIE